MYIESYRLDGSTFLLNDFVLLCECWFMNYFVKCFCRRFIQKKIYRNFCYRKMEMNVKRNENSLQKNDQ